MRGNYLRESASQETKYQLIKLCIKLALKTGEFFLKICYLRFDITLFKYCKNTLSIMCLKFFTSYYSFITRY